MVSFGTFDAGVGTPVAPPGASKLPFSHLHPRNEVGWTLVDTSFAWALSRWTWYLTDIRTPQPPKVTLRVGGVQWNLRQNRLVWTLTRAGGFDAQLGLMEDLALLKARVALCPRLRPVNGDIFDLRSDNLTTAGGGGPLDLLGEHGGSSELSVPPRPTSSRLPSVEDLLSTLDERPEIPSHPTDVTTVAEYLAQGRRLPGLSPDEQGN